MDSLKKLSPAALRHTFTKTTALNGKRTLAVKSSTPSSATNKKLNTKLIHGIMESMPHLAPTAATAFPVSSMSSSTPPSANKMKSACLEDERSMTTPVFGRLKDMVLDNDDEPSCSSSSMNDDGAMTEMPAQKHGCVKGGLINICFGAQGLTMEDSAVGQQTSKILKQQCIRVSRLVSHTAWSLVF
ncbi:hypothetical protein GUJ93_ZPchr0006g43643 [Zizania palustris]|uniref:Uncharacterized protein n=1 Tax=Zizania palustris TaxID=103762 RepID=A0A8J5SKS5_ZIZPA|nr:hypothetical protein GUJ93_ZPchr0006g43643 [Zizania palustris]